MASLHFIRHGQASFGAANYDQLSELGAQQAQALGALWRAQGQRCTAAFTGTLQRHRQTWAALRMAYEAQYSPRIEENGQHVGEFRTFVAPDFEALPANTEDAALDEYDSAALIHAALKAAGKAAAELPSARTPEGYKLHFRVLREALGHWIDGRITPDGMPSFADFRGGVAAFIDRIRAEHGDAKDAQIWVVSSGGPISTAVMHVLDAPAHAMIDLNYQLRNASVTSFQVSAKKVVLSGFNQTGHLAPALVTSA